MIRLFFCLCFSFFILFQPSYVWAEDLEIDSLISEKEKAVIAFFHLADIPPDYERWVKATSLYKSADEKFQDSVLIKEWLRLDKGYGLYNKDSGVLKLSFPILAEYTEPSDKAPSHFRIQFTDKKANAATPVFTYPYGDERISMIINNLSSFTDVPITEKQYKLARTVSPHAGELFDASIVVYVHPAKADYASPVIINNVKHWIMVGEIAYVRCNVEDYFRGNMKTLWEYIAPWYEEQYRLENMTDEQKYPHPYDLFKK